MKKTIKLAVVAALALGSTSAFATNGDVMIGQGAKSRAMGGVGIAKSFGAESGLANPAMLKSVESMEVTGALTFFMPDVDFKSNAASAAQGYPNPNASSSAADFSVIPEIAFAHRINDKFVYGVSLTGTAGMGTDYGSVAFGTPSDNGAFRMKTELALLKVAIPLAYQIDGFTMAVAPILQYGTLEMSHMRQTRTGGYALLNNGASSDTSYGYELGFSYDTPAIKGLTVAGVYKSEIGMTYDNTISSSVTAFGGAAQTGISSGDHLDQPAEIGVGIAYNFGGNTFAVDYKNIQWSKSEGYADFGWEDQDVFALGYEYAGSRWAVRVGYNHANSPIEAQNANPMTAGDAAYGGAIKNFFNLAGFPGIVEQHYTIGGGFDITKNFTIDGAFIYAPEAKESFDTTGMTAGFMAQGYKDPKAWGKNGMPTSSADVTHSQMSFTLAASYRF